MDLEEKSGVEDNLSRTCTICGAALTQQEIEASRESDAGVFLCTVHANEELPAVEEPAPGDV